MIISQESAASEYEFPEMSGARKMVRIPYHHAPAYGVLFRDPSKGDGVTLVHGMDKEGKFDIVQFDRKRYPLPMKVRNTDEV